MKNFTTQCAQGDTFYRRVTEIPKSATPTKRWDGVIAHSETGHNHVLRDATGCTFFTTSDPFVCYLRCETEVMLDHLREFDTHESIAFAPGCYEIRRQREATPQGFQRMVVD